VRVTEVNQPNRYPTGTFAQIAAIPIEARPRFLAELPAILATYDEMVASAENIATATRWPWWANWLPLRIKADLIRASLQKAGGVWIDDDKGLATLTISMNEQSDNIFAETRKMTSGQ
jgi:hypothetical protein